MTRKSLKLNNIFCCILFFHLLIFTISLGYEVLAWDALLTIIICVIFHCGLTWDTDHFMEALLWICELFIVINFVTMLLYPDGMYSKHSEYQAGTYELNWFLGYKNTMIRFILPAILFEFIDWIGKSWDSKLFVRKQIVFLICIFTMLKSSSANGIVGIMVFFLMSIFAVRGKLTKIFTPLISFLFFGAVSIGVIFFKIQLYFSFIISGILRRNVSTMSGRNKLWAAAWELIKQKPFLGWGNYSSTMLHSVGASHPHNFYMYITIRAGIIGALLFLTCLWLLSRKINLCRNRAFAGVISASIFSFFFMGVTESLTGAILLYPCFLVGAYEEKILGK